MEEDKTLYIAGMKSQSLVDEPGYTVAMIYLQGCNLDCGFCHNSSLIPMFTAKSKKTSIAQLLEKLEDNFLIDGVIFTGGEPTLQQNLLHFVKALSEKYKVIGVDTNGTNPKLLAEVSPFVTRIAMDVKCAFEYYEKVVGKKVDLEKIKASIDFLCKRSRESGRVEFRMVYAPPVISIEDVMAVAEYLSLKGFTGKFKSYFVIQQYIPSDGVREDRRKLYQTMIFDKLQIIAQNVKKYGIPVAIRCQEKGYFIID
nr:radical SAM protein [Candidatus Sigynarchaeota archaeon]